jgi:Xaa-Pro aminopeptidase
LKALDESFPFLELLPVDYPAQRRQQLAQALSGEDLDAYLLTNPVSVTYLTGFSGDSSHLILSKDSALLVSDARFTQQLAEECPELKVHIRPPGQNVFQADAEVVKKLGSRRIGFESNHLTVNEFDTLRELMATVNWKPAKDRVEKLRAVKDPSEIVAIREAIAIAQRAFDAFRALLRPEDSEKDLSDALEMYVRRCGGRCTSFPSIVASGERAALAHAPPTRRIIAMADLLLVDWGASGRFYKSDLTRVLITRKNSPFSQGSRETQVHPKLEEVYAVVLRAQEQALHRIRPGVKAHDVDAEARTVIAQAGFGDFFGHGLGHGIGLEIHEGPALRPNSDTVLQAGMVVTVEPGIYIPQWGGIRIEDDVLITSDGCEVLTSLPREWQAMVCDF